MQTQTRNAEQFVGTTLGTYRVERLLGQGQFNAVYLARHEASGQRVMIIAFNFPAAFSHHAQAEFLARFTQEGAAVVVLKHPNILPINDFGEQSGQLYIVTDFSQETSIAGLLKQQKRLSLTQTLNVLRQVASALDYAHHHGVAHGFISPTNILVNREMAVQLAGFGLRTLLEAHSDRLNKHPQSHLFSTSGEFLGNPAYVAPERVLGLPVDARADIYALGVLLFEMLSGAPPFIEHDPLETALARLKSPCSSLHALCPDIPEALDIVVSRAIERNPEQRYQHASEMVQSMERILKVLVVAQQPPTLHIQQPVQPAQDLQATMPPTVNWFEEELLSQNDAQGISLDRAATIHDASQVDSVDPFTWWAASVPQTTSPGTQALGAAPGTFSRSPIRLARNRPRSRHQQDRRRVIALIATSSVAVGMITIGGISFARFSQSMKQAQISRTQPSATTNTTTHKQTPTTAATTGTKKTPVTAKTPGVRPSPTKGSQATPTPRPATPTPTPPPSHIGTVIGYTSQGINTAKGFTNPADGNGGLLIHLTNGNFVACEKACTHQGVPVHYDVGQQKLICPAHGAVFDPFHGFSVVSGPAPNPLPTVSIRVNPDGTITTGK